ncbi:MAG TPA: LicD family protein [Paludibacteraceae bacterium]|nr:LicD family protein [Paludibacteraceae bacterium]
MKIIDLAEEKNLMMNILDSIDAFCVANNIHYSLCGGSAIGAIRHKGFIPWDDDIDIMMLRDDYEQFLSNYKDNSGNFVLHSFDRDKDWEYPFAKIENIHTIKEENTTNKKKIGVNIDIFPIDNLSDSEEDSLKLIRKVQRIRMALFAKIVKPSKRNSLYKKMCILALKALTIFSSKRSLAKKVDSTAKNVGKTNSKYIAGLAWGVYGEKELCPRSIFNSYLKIPFENREYSIISGYDIYLSHLYGDYMQLPTEDKRVSPHTINMVYWKE